MLTILDDEIRNEGKIEDTINMKNDCLDIHLVSKYTGLSIEEIEKL